MGGGGTKGTFHHSFVIERSILANFRKFSLNLMENKNFEKTVVELLKAVT